MPTVTETQPTVNDRLDGLDADVVRGPAGAVSNNNLAKWDGTGGRLLKDGGAGGGGGSGDVSGPGASVVGNLPSWDNTGGTSIDDSGVAVADVVQAILDSSAVVAAIGAPGGIATLNGSGDVPLSQLPTGTSSSTVALGDAPAAAVSTHASATATHGVSGAIVGTTDTQDLSNKKLTDANVTFADNSDPTKQLAFQCSGISAGTTRTVTAPDADGTLNVFTNAGSAPGSPVDGQRFWHTTHREWYRWDAGLGKWLGEVTHPMLLGAQRGSAAGTFDMGFCPASSSQTGGVPAYFGDRKIRLIDGAWAFKGGTGGGTVWTLAILNQSGTIFTFTNTVASATSWVKKNFEAIGVTVTAADTLTFTATRASGTENYQGEAIVRWCWEL